MALSLSFSSSLGFCILLAHALCKLRGLHSKHGVAAVTLLAAAVTLLYIGKTKSRRYSTVGLYCCQCSTRLQQSPDNMLSGFSHS